MSEVKRPRVLVVFGGRSSEHLVSCATAAGVLHALDRERFDVLAVGITRDGQWVRVDDNPELVDLRTASDTTIVPGLSRVSLLPGLARLVETTYDRSPEDHYAQIVGVEDLGVIDVVLPLLHGPYGEDGTIQGLFEMSDVRYVGCGVTSSSASMDKHLTKTVLAEAGISVGRWELVTEKQWSKDPQDVRARIDALGYPVFVKPTRAGSSVGISRVDSPDQLDLAIKEAAANDPRIIVEAMAHGREIECGVRVPAGGEAMAAPLGEIGVPEGEFYDYALKYVDTDAISLMCPADIPAEDAQRIQSIALKAFEALECEGLARVDFFYNDSTHEIIVNEVNTMPGFTRLSLYPRVWAEAGMSYTELVTSLLEEALSRPLGLR
ncbi:D-alanine--D-alanine ligase family protein [uncultured Actinomyces sp.]|uniref:D-alanine--D-alanine ligase family protein n=1 Tax=uncultured Actinomyces sp. TaxID=249061 RepID=UPI0028D3D48A|nr:D-alanine--D-alanine ligase family protein [uncultured Actinomyces sp.]